MTGRRRPKQGLPAATICQEGGSQRRSSPIRPVRAHPATPALAPAGARHLWPFTFGTARALSADRSTAPGAVPTIARITSAHPRAGGCAALRPTPRPRLGNPRVIPSGANDTGRESFATRSDRQLHQKGGPVGRQHRRRVTTNYELILWKSRLLASPSTRAGADDLLLSSPPPIRRWRAATVRWAVSRTWRSAANAWATISGATTARSRWSIWAGGGDGRRAGGSGHAQPLLWGAIGGLVNFVPYVGPVSAGVIAIAALISSTRRWPSRYPPPPISP